MILFVLALVVFSITTIMIVSEYIEYPDYTINTSEILIISLSISVMIISALYL